MKRYRIDSRSVLFFSLLILTAGCGGSINADYSKLDLVDVSGTVTLDGQPLSGATVAFEAGDGTFSSGVTNESGDFKLMFNSEQSGCLTGDKTVRIQFKGDSENPDEESEEEGGTSTQPQSIIPEQYNKKSTLKASVDSSHTTFEFDLKSKP
ncbi:carboxypeptidase-like regulatory domain-containing protein [uncultured Gimesia sp.]|uniref:carboxypeptidase-like regulatory domain-containing protein n=1 Tax=uncultured Gimesia sp. TaxID=1678688 RepID=UPI0030DB1757|tara:strand:- start:4096 stop:4551 length:456 start_codon:yes stop_codon:yes gene_type:complete